MNIKTNASNASNADSDDYVRPAGFPYGEAIIAAAPDIVDGGTTYQPIFYICEMDNFVTGTYNNAGYGIATGADAYVFSDEPSVLRVGSVVTHEFNRALDYSTSEGYKVRYVIAYATQGNKASVSGITINMSSMNSIIEFIAASGLRLSDTAKVMGNSGTSAASLKYANLSEIVNTTIVCGYFLSNCLSLKSLILSDNLVVLGGGYAIAYDFSLTNIVANKLVNATGTNIFSHNEGLKTLTLPELTTISSSFLSSCYSLYSVNLPKLTTVSGSNAFTSAHALKTFNAPLLSSITAKVFISNSRSINYVNLSAISTLTETTANVLPYTVYIELPTNFNITDVNFTGSLTKSIEWFHHLATQLFDRSATTTGTLILGAANIALIPTADAAMIAAKNWTLT